MQRKPLHLRHLCQPELQLESTNGILYDQAGSCLLGPAPATASSTDLHLRDCVGEGCIQDVIGAPLKDALQALLPSVQSLQVATAYTSSECFKWASQLPGKHSLHQFRAATKHRRGVDKLCRAISTGTAAEAPLAVPGSIATRLRNN